MAENHNSSGLALMARAGRAMSRWSVGTIAAVALVPAALAGPTGETIIMGDVTITREGDNVFITASDGSIIEYDSFNLSFDEMVTFFQPGVDSRVFNHIIGAMPSQIDGSIFANGIVYFVNPAGVIFGPTAVINVGGIYAAAAALDNADFLAGRDVFSNASGAVVNHGSIVGSRIHMLGNQVQNHGSLRADGGLVMMAAGESFLISEEGTNVMVHVDGRNAMLGPSAGATTPGFGSQAGVLNTGWIDAGTGTAVLAAGDLYALGIHNLGTIMASGGSVHVSANDGLVLNDGLLDVSAEGDAGSVVVRGPSIINRGSVRADSEYGQAGYAELTSQHHTLIVAGGEVSAQGLSGNAQGGEILIHSYNGYSLLSGSASLDVSGGAKGGDGGFAEFSGHRIGLRGRVDLSAKRGSNAGTLLLDPWDLRIGTGGAGGGEDDTAGELTDDNFLEFDENTSDSKPGDTSYLDVSVIEGLTGNIIIEAINDITVEAAITFTNDQSMVLNAGRDINLDAMITGASSLTLSADHLFVGYVFPNNTNDPTVGANGEDTQNNIGDVNISISGDLDFGSAAFFASGENINLDITTTSISANGLSLDGNFSTAANSLTLDAGSGALSLGVLTADTAATLVLMGNTITTTGGISADLGSISLQGDGTVGGSIIAGGNVTTNGNLDVTGSVGAGGNIDATGDLIASGTLLSGGSMSIVGNAAAGADISSGTTLDITGTLTMSGNGIQSIEAGGSASFGQQVTKALGDLSIEAGLGGGGALTLTGGAEATVGALQINSDASVGGNLISGTDLTLDNSITLIGSANQQISSGGTLTIAETINKADGDLDLFGSTGVDVDAAITLSNGAFSSGGGYFDNTGFAISGSSITLTHQDSVTIGGALIATSSIDLHAGLSGAGDLTVGAVDLNGQTIALRAGDGLAGNGVLASVSLNAGATFTNTGTFILEQDGAVDTALNGLTAGKFVGGLASALEIYSRDASVAINDGVLPTGLDFTVGAATTIGLNSALNVNSLTTDSGGLTTVTGGAIATNAISVTGSSLVQGAMDAGTTLDLLGNTTINNTLDSGGLMTFGGIATLNAGGNATSQAGMTFQGAATIGSSVSATDAMVFQDTANVNVNLTTGGALTFEQAATIAASLDSGGKVDFQGSATFSGLLAQSVKGTSVDLDQGASKATGSLTMSTALTTIGNQVTITSGDFIATGNVNTDSGITAGFGRVDISGDLAANSGSEVVILATTTIDVGGEASGTNGGLKLQSGSNTVGSLSSTGNGNITLQGNSTVAGNINVDGLLDVNGTLSLTSNVLQTVNAANGIDVSGQVARFGGDLIVGNDLILGGGLLGGEGLTGSGAVTFNGTVTLNGALDQSISSTGVLTVNDTMTKNNAGLTLAGSSIVGSSGGVTANAGALQFMGLTTLSSAAVQAQGQVLFNNTATVASVRSTGANIRALGDLNSTGLVRASSDIAVSGVLDADANVTADNGAITLTQGGTIGGTADAGTNLNTMGVTIIDGDARFATLDADADLTIKGTADGGAILSDQMLDIQTEMILTGTLTSKGVTTIGGNAQFGAIDADGTLAITGTATGGSITADTTLNIGGNVDLTGTLLASGQTTLGGNADAVNLFFDNTLTLTGNGVQTLAATGAYRAGVTTKASGDLVVSSATDTDLNGNVTVTSGGLTVSGPTTLGAAVTTIAASDAVLFNGTLGLTSSATIESTGDNQVRFNDNVTGNFATLTLNTAGNTVINGAMTAGELITDAGGETRIGGGSIITIGQQLYQDAVVLTADASVLSSGAGQLRFAQGVTGGFGLTTSTGGQTLMDAAADLGSWTTTALGSTVLTDNVTASNDLALANSVSITDSITLDAANVALTGGVNGAGHTLTLNSNGLTDLRGAFTLSTLASDSSGSMQMGGDFSTTSGISIGENAVLLTANTTIKDADVNGLEIGNGFSGAHSLLVQSAGDLGVTGGTYTQITDLEFVSARNILMQAQLGTDLNRLGSLSLQSGDLVLDAQDPGMIILDTNAIFTTGDVLFNANGRSVVPQLSTIGTTGDLLISSTTGDFLMGQNEKLTVLGELNIDLSFLGGFGTIARVGDITSLGNMIITADFIQIQSRLGQVLLAENPNVEGLIEAGEDLDTGVDFVTGGVFDWSVTPTVLNGNNADVLFGSLISDNEFYIEDVDLQGFVHQDFDGDIEGDLLRFENGTIDVPGDDLFFDLASSGPTLTSVAEALAGALPRDTEVQEVPAETPLSMTELRLLRELSIYAQRPDPEEYLSNARIGVALYDDNDTLFAEIPEVTVNRLLNDRVREVLDGFRSLVFLSEEEAAAAGTADRRVLVRTQLSEARLQFAMAASQTGESSPEDFHRFLLQSEQADAVEFLGRLNDLLLSVSNLGLTEREFRTARRLTLEQIKPDNIPLDELERLLELSKEGEQEMEAPVAGAETSGDAESLSD